MVPDGDGSGAATAEADGQNPFLLLSFLALSLSFSLFLTGNWWLEVERRSGGAVDGQRARRRWSSLLLPLVLTVEDDQSKNNGFGGIPCGLK